MNRLFFVLIALGHLTANKVTLELHEQKGLLEILEDIQMEQMTPRPPINIHDALAKCRDKFKAAIHGPAS